MFVYTFMCIRVIRIVQASDRQQGDVCVYVYMYTCYMDNASLW